MASDSRHGTYEVACRRLQVFHGSSPSFRAPVNLCIGQPGVHAIYGCNGAGKTTLARLLSGVIPHVYKDRWEGEVHVRGHELAGTVDPLALVTLVPEQVEESLLGLPPFDEFRVSVAVGRKLYGRTDGDLISEALGLHYLFPRDPTTLSSGERKRLQVAVGLVASGSILVLDEATRSLDGFWRGRLIELLRQLGERAERTILYLTPRVADAHLVGQYTHAPFSEAQAGEPFSEGSVGMSLLESSRGKFKDTVVAGRSVVVPESIRRNGFSLRTPGTQLSAGRIWVLTGCNGSGKTSLLLALAGLLRPRWQYVLPWIRPTQGASVVFSDPTCQIARPTIVGALGALVAGGEDVLQRFCAYVGKQPSDDPLGLSFAHRKLLVLLRALLSPTPLLLLDEPFGGLDETSARLAGTLVSRCCSQTDRVVVVASATGVPAYVPRECCRVLEARKLDESNSVLEGPDA